MRAFDYCLWLIFFLNEDLYEINLMVIKKRFSGYGATL